MRFSILSFLVLAACTPDLAAIDPTDGEWAAAARSTAESELVVRVANEATLDELDFDAKLDSRAAANLVALRPFSTIEEVDAVSYVGTSALDKMLAFGLEQWGLEDAPITGDALILQAANELSEEVLDLDVGLDARAAANIVDERPFTTLEELDAVAYVGPSALAKLSAYAEERWGDGACPRDHVISSNGITYDNLRTAQREAVSSTVLTLCPGRFEGGIGPNPIIGAGPDRTVLELHYRSTTGNRTGDKTVSGVRLESEFPDLTFDRWNRLTFEDVVFTMPLRVEGVTSAGFADVHFTSPVDDVPAVDFIDGYQSFGTIERSTFDAAIAVRTNRPTVTLRDLTLHNHDVAVQFARANYGRLVADDVDFGVGPTNNGKDVSFPGGQAVYNWGDAITAGCSTGHVNSCTSF